MPMGGYPFGSSRRAICFLPLPCNGSISGLLTTIEWLTEVQAAARVVPGKCTLAIHRWIGVIVPSFLCLFDLLPRPLGDAVTWDAWHICCSCEAIVREVHCRREGRWLVHRARSIAGICGFSKTHKLMLPCRWSVTYAGTHPKTHRMIKAR